MRIAFRCKCFLSLGCYLFVVSGLSARNEGLQLMGLASRQSEEHGITNRPSS